MWNIYLESAESPKFLVDIPEQGATIFVRREKGGKRRKSAAPGNKNF